jgi:predicted transporter
MSLSQIKHLILFIIRIFSLLLVVHAIILHVRLRLSRLIVLLTILVSKLLIGLCVIYTARLLWGSLPPDLRQYTFAY